MYRYVPIQYEHCILLVNVYSTSISINVAQVLHFEYAVRVRTGTGIFTSIEFWYIRAGTYVLSTRSCTVGIIVQVGSFLYYALVLY